MDDLISRRDAIRAIAEAYEDTDAEWILRQLPSVQPELVWCKDCKWYDPTHPYGTVIPDAFHCKTNDRFYKASHFCGYGERRE